MKMYLTIQANSNSPYPKPFFPSLSSLLSLLLPTTNTNSSSTAGCFLASLATTTNSSRLAGGVRLGCGGWNCFPIDVVLRQQLHTTLSLPALTLSYDISLSWQQQWRMVVTSSCSGDQQDAHIAAAASPFLPATTKRRTATGGLEGGTRKMLVAVIQRRRRFLLAAASSHEGER